MIIPNLYEKLGLNLQEVAYNYIEIWFKFVVIPPSQCTSMFPQIDMHCMHKLISKSGQVFRRSAETVLQSWQAVFLLISLLHVSLWLEYSQQWCGGEGFTQMLVLPHESITILWLMNLCAFTERGRVYLHSASSSRWSTERRAALREVEPHTERQVRSNL